MTLERCAPGSSLGPSTAIRGDGKQHERFADCVVRFANAEIEGDIDSALARIRAELRAPFD
jgi:hypothetical protein